MLLSVLSPLLVLPFVSAGVHKFKLQKLPQADSNPTLESAYLAEKYGSQGQVQLPLMGAGGAGRQIRINRPSYNQEGEDLFWTQDMINNGGHGVPLSSTCIPIFQLCYVMNGLPPDFMNAQYFTTISLGTPPQEVCLHFRPSEA